jgi:hypothetical protein
MRDRTPPAQTPDKGDTMTTQHAVALCQPIRAGLSGPGQWFAIVALAAIMFFAARAFDTYRHRLARDRALADAYRLAMHSRGGAA